MGMRGRCVVWTCYVECCFGTGAAREGAEEVEGRRGPPGHPSGVREPSVGCVLCNAVHVMCVVMCIGLMGAIGACAAERADASEQKRHEEKSVTTHQVRGEFEVNMSPQTDSGVSDPAIGRFGLDKTYRGPLEATSKGQMLGFRSAVKGSAAIYRLRVRR